MVRTKLSLAPHRGQCGGNSGEWIEDMSYAEWQGLFLATKGMSLIDVLVESLRNIRDNLRCASSGHIPPNGSPIT